jgi:hypothetical protein
VGSPPRLLPLELNGSDDSSASTSSVGISTSEDRGDINGDGGDGRRDSAASTSNAGISTSEDRGDINGDGGDGSGDGGDGNDGDGGGDDDTGNGSSTDVLRNSAEKRLLPFWPRLRVMD